MNNLVLSIFRKYSNDEDYLNKQGCTLLFLELYGRKPTRNELQLILNAYDVFANSDEKEKPLGISYTNLISILRQIQNNQDFQNNEVYRRLLFDCLDKRGKNFLTLLDFYKASETVAPHLPSYILEAVFKEFDRDGDGRVSYEDFLFIIRNE